MFTIDELEISILGYFWNARYWTDRQGTAFSKDTNALTGLPESENTLLPNYRGTSGFSLVLGLTPVPAAMATSMMKYETAEGEMRELSLKPLDKWTDDERNVHNELTHRLKIAAHRLAGKGFVNLNPPDDQGNPQPYADDGLTARFQLTSNGLEEARRVIVGSKHDGQTRGWQDALAPSEHRLAPEWLQSKWRSGGREGLGSISVDTKP